MKKYLPHYLENSLSTFHQWVISQLSTLPYQRGAKISCIAPRGAAKSTWVSFAYPLYAALHGLEKYIIIISDTTAQARLFLESIKGELEGNDAIMADYPWARKGSIWAADRLLLGNDVLIEAFGTGAKLRGRRHKQHRPSVIIVDDPQNDEHTTSAVQRTRTWNWFTKAALNAGSPSTNYLVVGTALHREAIVCRLEQTSGWQHKLFRALIQAPTHLDLWQEWEEKYTDWYDPQRDQHARQFYLDNKAMMDEGAIVLWPERFDLYSLMSLRVQIGEAAFNSEQLGNPLDPASCEWPPDYFEGNIWFDEWPKNLEVKTIALDPSKGGGDMPGDYSAFVLYGRDPWGVEYVEADMGRWDTSVIVDKSAEWIRVFRPDGFSIETNQFQELLKKDLERVQTERREAWPIYGIMNYAKKEVRIRRHTPYLSQRKVRFRRHSPGTIILMNQCRDFPNAEHDDGPDAWEQARRLAIELYNGKRGG